MKISIITVCFNSQDTIRDTIESVLSQTHPHIEYIIVDGASSDNTLPIIQEYQDQISKVVSEPDKGIYDAMNKGIALARGEVIGALNADDFYADSEVLAKVACVFEDPATIEACYGDLLYVKPLPSSISQDFKVVRYWKSGAFKPQKFYQGWMPPHPTFFVRRTVYERFGTFNLDLGTAADYEIMLRFLLKHLIKPAYIPEILVQMRVGGASNDSVNNRFKANRNDRKAWEVNGLKPAPWTLAMKPLRKLPQWWLRP